MSLPFNTSRIVSRATNIEGWSLILKNAPVDNMETSIIRATEDLEDRYSDWDSDQGFGSSDSTYAVKYFLDSVIINNNLYTKLKTDFTPYLSIVEKV